MEQTPGAWLEQLEHKLNNERDAIERYIRYRTGKHDLRYATAKFRQAFGGLFREFADNWCETIVEAPIERLRVQGFRFGSDQKADSDAWGIWQANSMDTLASTVHREAVTCGEAFWLVEPPRPGAKYPRITAEHPLQVTVITDPADPTRRLAALKRWIGIDGYGYANVYLPEAVHKFRSANKLRVGSRPSWRRREDDPGGENVLKIVSMVPVVNAPDMTTGGRSDLRNAIPLQDAINKTVLDMLVASEFAAWRQRVVIGVETPKGPDGKLLPDADIKMAMSKLLTFKGSDVKTAEFSATDLSNYTTALEPLVAHLAAQTRTPPHYLLGQMVNVSGDALKASESGLVARTREKMTPFGEGHEETMRLAFLAMGDEERANATRVETIWADPEFRNTGELIDGLVKLKTLGIPDEILWERAGFSPTEIDRIKTMQAADDILNPPPPPPPPPGSTAQAALPPAS